MSNEFRPSGQKYIGIKKRRTESDRRIGTDNSVWRDHLFHAGFLARYQEGPEQKNFKVKLHLALMSKTWPWLKLYSDAFSETEDVNELLIAQDYAQEYLPESEHAVVQFLTYLIGYLDEPDPQVYSQAAQIGKSIFLTREMLADDLDISCPGPIIKNAIA